MNYCLYYQAHVEPARCWYLTAILRSHEHVAFDRTIDVEHSIFEFFVPADSEHMFLQIMSFFQDKGIVHNLQKQPNRLSL